jgi:glycosyltransferase involved in cell wall biosynthesis
MTNILFAFKNPNADNPGACHAGLGVTALNSVMTLRDARIQADGLPVTNGEYLWSKLSGEWSAFSHIVLCAPFIDAPFLTRLVQAFPLKHFALVYHSNLGFLSVDRFAARSLPQLLALETECPNFKAATNSAELSAAIGAASGKPFTLLPNLYHLPHTTRRLKDRWRPPMALHVGLFGAARVLKNWLTAAAAAMILQRAADVPLSLHINSGRDEGAEGTRGSLRDLLALNPAVSLVEAPWMPVDDFRRYLYGMDLMLQPSFTETFNNVTADGAACGVPSVVSDAITWAPQEWMARSDSAVDIARVAMRVLRDKHAAQRGCKALDTHNLAAMQSWREWIG